MDPVEDSLSTRASHIRSPPHSSASVLTDHSSHVPYSSEEFRSPDKTRLEGINADKRSQSTLDGTFLPLIRPQPQSVDKEKEGDDDDHDKKTKVSDSKSEDVTRDNVNPLLLPPVIDNDDDNLNVNDNLIDNHDLDDDVISLSSPHSDASGLAGWQSKEGCFLDDAGSLSSLDGDSLTSPPDYELDFCMDCSCTDQNSPFCPAGLCNVCREFWIRETTAFGKRLLSRIDKPLPPQKRRGRPPKARQMSLVHQAGNIMKHDASESPYLEQEDRQKTDHGFRPNEYDLSYQQQVQILNINGHWYRGVLHEMRGSKVKVVYKHWQDQMEWVIMGSRRLKTIIEEEDDTDADLIPLDTRVLNTPTQSTPHSQGPDSSQQYQQQHQQQPGDDLATLCAKAAKTTRKHDDYVSATHDRDPEQLFNDCQVLLTRRMAKQLVDEHGFRANAHGYRYNRAMAVASGKRKVEYLAYLRQMENDKVRVWYPTLQTSEWIPVGSRRMRLLVAEEEAALTTLDVVPPPAGAVDTGGEQEDDESSGAPVVVPKKRGRGRPRKTQPQLSPLPPVEATPHYSPEEQPKEKPKIISRADKPCYLTTGAFATRHAMRQLQDEHGFVPNPYGYTYDLAVEVLNTRTARKKFWDRGHLVEMRPGQVKVRYDGWSEVYDEWIKVGSRRIRTLEDASHTDGTTDPQSSMALSPLSTAVTTTPANTARQSGPEMSAINELLIMEKNPELSKRSGDKGKHRVLGPDDYLRLGYLVDMEAEILQKKKRGRPKKKVEAKATRAYESDARAEQRDDVKDPDYTDRPPPPKRSKTLAKKMASKRRRPKVEISADVCTPEAMAGQFPNLAAALVRRQTKVSKDYVPSREFPGNVYGYDYMLHVQVLHLDKKWYEGRLVHLRGNRVRIHFCGWLDAFDEYVMMGSPRIQVIENDHTVECLEPGYCERYEALVAQGFFEPAQPAEPKKKRRRRVIADEDDVQIEYHKELSDTSDVEEIDAWKVYCNQCKVVIRQFRYYCTYCETPSEGHDYESFELCLKCFDQNFPFMHEHPRSGFAVQSVIDSAIGPMPIKGELVTVWEEDMIGDLPEEKTTSENAPHEEEGLPAKAQDRPAHPMEASQVFDGNQAIQTADEGYAVLKRWQRRKVCAFCNDDDDTSDELGAFIGPFVIATFNKNGIECKRQFWAHDACARYSPEVFCTPEGKWYNVTLALRRGRGNRCYVCKEKGATIGCFDARCTKSFHLPCAQKPVSYFQNGVIFWCPTHEAYYNKKDTYVNIFKCDGCKKEMGEETWFSCVPCAAAYFSSFDLCAECFDTFPTEHAHSANEFEETSFLMIKEMEAQKARESVQTKEKATPRKRPLFPRRSRMAGAACCYCGTQDADEWRKGYDGGVVMCRPCFEVALQVDNNDGASQAWLDAFDGNNPDRYMASIEDYTHKPYLTRDALSASKFSSKATADLRLATYEPQPHQLFSLVFDSTYFDIPGRAPRWATHSGTDYHGTWLPQTVRRAILKYTSQDERILANFLGRGTDAIECFLLQRRCCGLDINPAAVALAQRNCCFEIPPGLTSAEYRPIIAQADSRHLEGPLFIDDSFHHILSHPPYKDCVAYSTHLEGDLSRYTNIEDFKNEYIHVVRESWRLLHMGRRLTLGIGDNREHCFYVPVSFHLMRQYIDEGFELEELIVKRQRYCSAFGLGTYLCVQYDFLVFTHEFIATFRKVPKELTDRMLSYTNTDCTDHVRLNRSIRGVPSSAITRKSVVMGTVWVFRPNATYRFENLCVSRMVQRFGRDDTNWELIEIEFVSEEKMRQAALLELQQTEQEKQLMTDGKKKGKEQEVLSEYEQQRLKRIKENTRTLLELGLISGLSEESDDVVHYETMMTKSSTPEGRLGLIVVNHLPCLSPSQIGLYRETLVKIAREATQTLAPHGMLVIGTKDVRSCTGKLWPMSLLVLEDIERVVDRRIMKLKEMVVAVPDGYSKMRNKDDERQKAHEETQDESDDPVDIVDEHLPIVHAIYLIFQKL
ncbi:hypothetical protein BCR43DRAFT_496172 [Syncephalastrum racemosum]|uniref:PHD-type domain-containing protein n=1 Tax=Syncephalastrum racemosum TaxID=13706 RepID=A0A1X2H3M7_SYNRA|nr:hypothetical protein BCR43DRAFT_496172 [Syncephalastrum racemosum]